MRPDVEALPVHYALLYTFITRPHYTCSRKDERQAWFERWLRQQLQVLPGWSVQELLPAPQGDLLLAWG